MSESDPTVQVSPQVMPLRSEAASLGLSNLRVERLDLTDPYDITQAFAFFDSITFNELWTRVVPDQVK